MTDPTPDTPAIPGDELLAEFTRIHTMVEQMFEDLDWLVDEIRQAQQRHPDHADLLYHALPILHMPSWPPNTPRTELVVRGHARELLNRVAAGEDTRPGTAAEICLGFAEVSPHHHMTGGADTVYFRMFRKAFPDQAAEVGIDDPGSWYEQEADQIERDLRRKLAQPKRRLDLKAITCNGDHDGTQVPCRFAPSQPQLPGAA